MDRISELPDDILSSIISKLSMKDAVKIRLLSSRWRHVVSSLSNLRFCYGNMLPIERRSPYDKEYMDQFVRAVNQFLDSYKGTRIIKIYVRLYFSREYTDDVDQWINFAVRMGAKELEFAFYYNGLNRRNPNTRYVFGRDLLAQGPEEPKLEILKLRRCLLGPNLQQFSCLRTLELTYVPLGQREMQIIFSYFLDLEVLHLSYCNVPPKLSFPGSLHLRDLHISSSDGLEEIELSPMNLRDFKYACCNLVKFSFVGISKIERFNFHIFDEGGMHYVFRKLANDLPMLKCLHVCTGINWVQSIPVRISIFREVHKLKLNLCTYHECIESGILKIPCNEFNMLKVIAILKAFPLLQELRLKTNCPIDVEQEGKLELGPSKFVNEHLEYVKLSGFYATSNQIDLAIYFLKYAVALKRLLIRISKRSARPSLERQKVCQRLQEFSKDVLIVQ